MWPLGEAWCDWEAAICDGASLASPTWEQNTVQQSRSLNCVNRAHSIFETPQSQCNEIKCVLKESNFNAKNGSKFSRLLTRKRLLQQKVDKTRRSTVETKIKVKDTLKYKQVYTSRVFFCQFYAYLMPKGLLRNMQFFDFMLFFPRGIPNCFIHNNL